MDRRDLIVLIFVTVIEGVGFILGAILLSYFGISLLSTSNGLAKDVGFLLIVVGFALVLAFLKLSIINYETFKNEEGGN